jgi:hypothetical protein
MIPPLCEGLGPWFHCICNWRLVGPRRLIFLKRVFDHFGPLFWWMLDRSSVDFWD